MTALKWRTVTRENDARFLVKGTELATAIVPDTLSRYQVCEHRCYDADGHLDRNYRLRDADTISDDERREGIRPRIVGPYFFTPEAAIIWAQSQISA